MLALYRSFSSLDRPARRRVTEAAALVILVWAALRVLPFSAVRSMLAHYARRRAARSVTAAAEPILVRRAVTGIAARWSFARNCLVQALTAHTMLASRGVESDLHIGVRRNQASLEAHAWVDCHGAMVVGDIDRLPHYALLVQDDARGRPSGN